MSTKVGLLAVVALMVSACACPLGGSLKADLQQNNFPPSGDPIEVAVVVVVDTVNIVGRGVVANP